MATSEAAAPENGAGGQPEDSSLGSTQSGSTQLDFAIPNQGLKMNISRYNKIWRGAVQGSRGALENKALIGRINILCLPLETRCMI